MRSRLGSSWIGVARAPTHSQDLYSTHGEHLALRSRKEMFFHGIRPSLSDVTFGP